MMIEQRPPPAVGGIYETSTGYNRNKMLEACNEIE